MANPAPTWRIRWITATWLAVDTLRASRAATITSVGLVAASVLCVVGADHSFRQLAGVVQRLAEGGGEASARLEVHQCPRCERARMQSTTLQALVQRSALAAVRVHRFGTQPVYARAVPVVCTPPWLAPRAVDWRQAGARQAWSEHAGVATVLVGADLASGRPASAPDASIGTEFGVWYAVGTLRARPLLAANAADNGAIVVPWRPPFDAACARGRVTWQVVASDSVALRQTLTHVEDELRTHLQLRPATPPPWRVQRTDRFGQLVHRLVQRFSLWVMAVPITIALLSGAGVFSVQALEGAMRIQEFGVRRAVGASPSALVHQLLMEMLLTSVAGIGIAGGLLAALGLLGGSGAGSVWHSLLLASAVAIPTCALGVLLPGLTALRASSIASLEGRTP